MPETDWDAPASLRDAACGGEAARGSLRAMARRLLMMEPERRSALCIRLEDGGLLHEQDVLVLLPSGELLDP